MDGAEVNFQNVQLDDEGIDMQGLALSKSIGKRKVVAVDDT